MIKFVRQKKAVIGQGEWRFGEHYSSLTVSNVSWFSQMSDSTKSIHMKKVFSQKPSCVSEPSKGLEVLLVIALFLVS